MLKKLALAGLTLLALSEAAVAQTSPGWVYNQTPTAAQWNAAFAGKQDLIRSGAITSSLLASGAAVANLGFTPLNPANNLFEISNAATARTNLGFTGGLVPASLLAPGAAAANLAGGAIAPSSISVNSGPINLGPYTMTGGNGIVATIPSTYGTWDQAVGASVVVNSTHGPEIDGFNASGYLNFPGVANYPGRDSVAFYADNTAPPAIATVAGTFDATHFYPSTAINSTILSQLKVGMFIDTTDATKFTGVITGWAANGTSITVSAWYQMGNTGAGQVPSGPNAVLSPITGIWAHNAQTFLTPTSYANQSIGFEIDVNNNKAAYSGHGADTTAWGYYVGNSGTYNGAVGFYQAGQFWDGFKSQQAQNTAFAAYDYTGQNPSTAFMSYQTSGLHFGAYVGGKWRFQVDNRGYLYLGDQGTAQNTAISLFSSGRTTWDSQIYSGGGTASQGNGALNFIAASHSFYEASSANAVVLKGSATGTSAKIAAAGSDATINLSVSSKSTGLICLGGADCGAETLRVQPVASQVNSINIKGAATAAAPSVIAQGTDTDINLQLTPKGVGVVTIASGGVALPPTTVASLPACTAGRSGYLYYVTDATAPAYNATLTGSGAVKTLAMCNGSGWTAH